MKLDTKLVLDTMHQEGKKLKLVIRAVSSKGVRSRVTSWDSDAELVLNILKDDAPQHIKQRIFILVKKME